MAKVVVCEDSDKLQKLLSCFLAMMGHEVWMASNGLEGLNLVIQQEPDIVITDIGMQQWDGLLLLQAIRASRLAKTPVIMMTGFDDKKEEALKRGADGVLTKPFEFKQFQEIVTIALKNREINNA